MKAVGIDNLANRSIDELAGGEKALVLLARLLAVQTEFLLVDEPTSGLDPNQIVEIRQLIKEIGKEKTVVFSTHILSEAEATCDRVVIINRGEIVADGATDHLIREFGGGAVVDLLLQHDDALMVNSKLRQVAGIERLEEITQAGEGLVKLAIFSKEEEDIRPALYRVIREQGWDLLDFHRRSESLENVFAQLTREN